MKISIIAGLGEVGSSLLNVLKQEYTILTLEKGQIFDDKLDCDILHITFPYSEEFESEVKKYQELYKPQWTVIHSTVPVGTSRKLDAIHSAILGIHPNLESGIRTFTKFLGGEQASEVANYFRRVGLKVYLFDKPEASELMKILDTTFYGVCIEYTKDVKKQCEKYGIPFEAWTIWTNNYNEGYKKLGHSEFTRPNLVPVMTKIGGHCVLPNTNLLETPFTKFLKELNEN